MKKILLLFALIFLIGISSAEIQLLGTFKQDNPVILYQICDNCSYVNISSIVYPNLSIILSEIPMVKNGVTYSYELNGSFTHLLGNYIVCGYGDLNSIQTTWCYNFLINPAGRTDPPGAVQVFFFITFLIIIGAFIFLFIYSFGHFLKKDFDLIDLSFDFGIYFVMVAYYILQQQYFANPLIDDITYIFVYVGAFTHVLISLIFFIVNMIWQNLDKQRQMAGTIR